MQSLADIHNHLLWLAQWTMSGDLTWHSANGPENEGSGDIEIQAAIRVAHATGNVGRRFGGAIVGLRGPEKIPCVVIIDGNDEWFYHDAEGQDRETLLQFIDVVKLGKKSSRNCTRCQRCDSQYRFQWK